MNKKSINAEKKEARAISFISNTGSIADGTYQDENEAMGDLPQETTPLIGNSQSKYFEEDNFPRKSRTNTMAGSFIASVSHTISISIRRLKKSVGFLQGFTLIVGVLVGSGVFISPSLVMAETADAGLALSMWLFCGLIALGGSLCYCELGCAIKRAGGNYAYILEAYGNLPAFLCSWTIAFIVDPAGVAAICLTFGVYVLKPFEEFIGTNPWYPKALAAACILLICFTNCWSVKAATRAQTFFTFAQILAVVFVGVVGCWQLGEGKTQNLKGMFNITEFGWENVGPIGMMSLCLSCCLEFVFKFIYLHSSHCYFSGAALYNCLWAYDGWALVSNVTEEMVNLERNLFLSVITAIPFVIGCYVFVNISFLAALTVKEIGDSPAVAVTFISKTLGSKVAYVMPVLVAFSCYGAANGTVFACGRLSLAAGREGHLPELFSMIHKRRYTPIPAILMTSLISILMLIPDASSLETLIGFFNFACWFIYGLSLFAVVILRIRQPELHRPYKVWIITPILMTLMSILLVVMPFFYNPVNPAIASGLIGLGIPVYYLLIYLEPKHPAGFISAKVKIIKSMQKFFNLAPCPA